MNTGSPADRRLPYAVASTLGVLVIALYLPVRHHAFVSFDDPRYVTENPYVLKGLTREGIAWAFTTFHLANWHPLTWISHMVDVEIFGVSPGAHHGVNVVLHLLNAELLFLVFWRMTGAIWRSAFVAALFAVHPLHVESVAWVSERKDVLSTFFALLTLLAYDRYVRKPGVRRYLPLAGFFVLGLLSKPMLVTLPAVLLLLDYWPLRRAAPVSDGSHPTGGIPWPRLIREKVPLFALSILSCGVTILAEVGRGPGRLLPHVPPGLKVSNAVVSYSWYLWKTVLPSGLAVFYPHPATLRAGIPAWQVAAGSLLLLGISSLAVSGARRRPWLAAGWAWYVVTLLPVIGLVQVGAQARADRYTYIPLVGIFLAAVWAGAEAAEKRHAARKLLVAAGVAWILALAATARAQVGNWGNSGTLFAHALSVTENNWRAWGHLGVHLSREGRYPEAVDAFAKAVALKPDYASAWYHMGIANESVGRDEQAVACYRKAAELWPDLPGVWRRLATLLSAEGRHAEAAEAIRGAVRNSPEDPALWKWLGAVSWAAGLLPESSHAYREAVRLDPEDVEALAGLGAACARLGSGQEALEVYGRLRGLDPSRAEAFRRQWIGNP